LTPNFRKGNYSVLLYYGLEKELSVFPVKPLGRALSPELGTVLI
jgi:hypothetical protein